MKGADFFSKYEFKFQNYSSSANMKKSGNFATRVVRKNTRKLMQQATFNLMAVRQLHAVDTIF